jgi:hypothetical protein
VWAFINSYVSVSVATWRSVSSRDEVATDTETKSRLETERQTAIRRKIYALLPPGGGANLY